VIEPTSTGLTWSKRLKPESQQCERALGPIRAVKFERMAQLQSLGCRSDPATETHSDVGCERLIFRSRAADALQGQALASY